MCWVHGHAALGLGTGRARATSRDAEFGRRDATSRSDRGFVRPSVRPSVRTSVRHARVEANDDFGRRSIL